MFLIHKYFAHALFLLITLMVGIASLCHVVDHLHDAVLSVIFGISAVLMGIAAIAVVVDMFLGLGALRTSKVGLVSTAVTFGLMILAYFSVSRLD